MIELQCSKKNYHNIHKLLFTTFKLIRIELIEVSTKHFSASLRHISTCKRKTLIMNHHSEETVLFSSSYPEKHSHKEMVQTTYARYHQLIQQVSAVLNNMVFIRLLLYGICSVSPISEFQKQHIINFTQGSLMIHLITFAIPSYIIIGKYSQTQ